VGLVANVGPQLASAAGIRVEDFIIDCRFMNDVCNLSQLFVKTFDSYYYNCFTFQPQMILKSRATRLSGVEYGLSLLLFLGLYMCTVLTRLGLAIAPLCHGTGAPFDEHMQTLLRIYENGGPKLLLMAEPLKHPSPTLVLTTFLDQELIPYRYSSCCCSSSCSSYVCWDDALQKT